METQQLIVEYHKISLPGSSELGFAHHKTNNKFYFAD